MKKISNNIMKEEIISLIIISIIASCIIGGVYLGLNGYAGLGFCIVIVGVATFIFNVPIREKLKKIKDDNRN